MDQTELRVARFCGEEEAHEARCVPGRDGGMEDVVALNDVAAPKWRRQSKLWARRIARPAFAG